MAFFKFRFPGQHAATPVEGASAASADSIEMVRRRARYRLIGAVVLVFVAVVAFPLLFDTQPRPVAVDTPILIPDRDHAPALNAAAGIPPAQAPAKPLLPADAVVAAQASLDKGTEELVLPTPAPTVVAATAATKATDAQLAASAPTSASAKPATPSQAGKSENPLAAKPANDGAKAKALLEGKAAAQEPVKLVLQVGAFTDPDKVREVRRKLEQAGFKTYTQVVDGKDGKKTTRVRVGPYDSRSDADKAAAGIRKLDLPVAVLTL